MSAAVIPIRRGFDPRSEDAEQRYDCVVHRMNQLCAASNHHRRLISELERQFVENDLIASSGANRGKPLTRTGRLRRLKLLLRLSHEQRRMDEEREGLRRELDVMNGVLDAWARETYGIGPHDDLLDDRPPATKK